MSKAVEIFANEFLKKVNKESDEVLKILENVNTIDELSDEDREKIINLVGDQIVIVEAADKW